MGNSNTKIYDWDATASFSWYLYQADVALLFALIKILSLKKYWNEDKLKNWSLEVEGEEDFTLSNNENNFKELFQVKETYWNEPKDYTIPVIKLYESFKLWWDKKELLVTTKDLWNIDNIDFFDWLYARNNLTKDQVKLKYLFDNNTFLTEKIIFENDKYKFNNTETKDTIKEYVLQKTSEFIKEENFVYICWWSFTEVQLEIKEKISKVRLEFWKKDDINQEHYFRYLESYIKRFIQRRKVEWLEEQISLENVILNTVLKDWNEVFDELVEVGFYEDIFINYFINKFNLKIGEIKNNNIFLYIKDDLWEDEYCRFIDTFKESISYNIFLNEKKLFLFIRHVSPKKSISYFDSLDKIWTFNKLIDDISSFTSDEAIKNKLILLLKLFYLKYKWLIISKDKYFSQKSEKDLDFSIYNKKAIITWNQQLNDDERKDDMEDIINSNIEYLFQKDFIWIKNSWWRIIEILWVMENISEDNFIKDDENIQKWILNDKINIVKEKDIRIFCCWCSVDNKEKMLSEECWLENNCVFKN